MLASCSSPLSFTQLTDDVFWHGPSVILSSALSRKVLRDNCLPPLPISDPSILGSAHVVSLTPFASAFSYPFHSASDGSSCPSFLLSLLIFPLVSPGQYFFPKIAPDYDWLNIESRTSNICTKEEKSCLFYK